MDFASVFHLDFYLKEQDMALISKLFPAAYLLLICGSLLVVQSETGAKQIIVGSRSADIGSGGAG